MDRKKEINELKIELNNMNQKVTDEKDKLITLSKDIYDTETNLLYPSVNLKINETSNITLENMYMNEIYNIKQVCNFKNIQFPSEKYKHIYSLYKQNYKMNNIANYNKYNDIRDDEFGYKINHENLINNDDQNYDAYKYMMNKLDLYKNINDKYSEYEMNMKNQNDYQIYYLVNSKVARLPNSRVIMGGGGW